MSLISNDGGLSAADIAAVMGNNGNGNGFNGGDGAWWLIVLFLFAFAGNGFGNGFGGGFGGATPYVANDVQNGFDQAAVMSGINGINSALASAEVSRCNAQTNVLQALNTNQAATTSAINDIAMGLQNCCCENRAATADLKYTVATEGAADRSALQQALQSVIMSQNSGTQSILDKLCQLEMDGIKQNYENQLTTLRTQNSQLLADLNSARFAESQSAQTAAILANNEAQTATLEQYLAPTPKPAYVVQNPNCCAMPYYNTGCGCGVA